MSEPNAPQPALNELQQIDARVLEAERRVIPAVRNFLKMRRTLDPEDPRREATRSALLWCFLSPANAVGAAGVGSLVVAFMTITLAREGNEIVREELVHIKEQNELSQKQFKAQQEQFVAQQEQFVAQQRAEANRRRGELLVRLFERRDCKTEADPQDCPYAADSQSRVYAFVELAGVQNELSRLEKGPRLGMNGIDLSGIRFPVQLNMAKLIAAGIDLSYAQLRDLQISDAKFVGGNLQRTEFTDVTVRDTSFEGADLRGAKFTATEFINVDFSSADLIDADLSEASFVGCTFKDADLTWANVGGGALLASMTDVKRCPNGERPFDTTCEKQISENSLHTHAIELEFYSRVEAHLMREPGGGFAGESVQVTVGVDPRMVQSIRVMAGSIGRAHLQSLQRHPRPSCRPHAAGPDLDHGHPGQRRDGLDQ